MKIGDSIIFILLGALLGIGVHSCMTTTQNDLGELSCNSMEEAKLKMALRECSDAVMGYAWGDIEQ